MAMRGLRPIAEIQYLDYVLYALQIMSDDLATLHWRTRRAKSAGHRAHARPPAGRRLALRLADGGTVHLLRGITSWSRAT
jgi:2-oxoisovalerate dehydrogenase E1 component